MRYGYKASAEQFGPFAQQLQDVNVIGASGAIYGLLLGYAIYFPDRPILLIVFWVPARLCVTILGAIAPPACCASPSLAVT